MNEPKELAPTDREAFEQWLRKEASCLKFTWLPLMGVYAEEQPQWLWVTWNAARAAPAAPTAEGRADDNEIACSSCGLTMCQSRSLARPQEAAEPVDYERVVSICDAHGIGLPVDCVEMVVEIIRHAAPPQPAVQREGLILLRRVVTALPMLRAMLAKEGLAGVDIADELINGASALLRTASATGDQS